MKIKTSELSGAALDWAVAQCEGFLYRNRDIERQAWLAHGPYEPSTDWAQGGPVIEQEQMLIACYPAASEPWMASYTFRTGVSATGPTPLIAAMRCYVASKLGDEVDIPEELA